MDSNTVLVSLLLTAAAVIAPEPAAPAARSEISNPAIDMPGFLDVSRQAAEYRASRRISEEEFLRMSAEPNTIVLDARSAQRFAQLHVRGAINLSFPDIAVDSLAATIPDKGTRILIYCNNNFLGASEPFPAKLATASLNLSTYVALYDYGYRNVYELGPLVRVEQSKLPFEGSEAAKIAAKQTVYAPKTMVATAPRSARGAMLTSQP